MRRVFDEQTYLNFRGETSLKVVKEYRAKYAWIDECLKANPLILWLVHEDLETLSQSQKGREAKYTTEILFRALLVHQIERTSLRETVIRIAESPTLQSFLRLGTRPVPDVPVNRQWDRSGAAKLGLPAPSGEGRRGTTLERLNERGIGRLQRVQRL